MSDWIKTHRYSLVGLYLFVFLAGFFIVQQVITEPVYILHSVVDDWIPFNEWFVLPYVLWYAWFPGFLLYFMFRDREAYLRLCFVMFTGMTISLIIYVIWPNGLDLRREITTDNLCAKLVQLLRTIDSSANVCPSIHVSSTMAVHRAIGSAECFRGNKRILWLSCLVTWAICLSTMFIKQHSVIDVVCGWALTEVLHRGYRIWEKRRND